MKSVRPNLAKFSLAASLLASFAFAASGNAATITPNLNTFTLTNTSADGAVSISPNGSAFVLTGGNTGSGLPGFTDFTSTALLAGTVQFNYSYSSLDLAGFDVGGYLLGNTRFALADTDGQSGSASFNTSVGQVYGWYVSTLDNTGEPGVLNISLSSASNTVPEPAESAMMLSGMVALALMSRRVSRVCKKGVCQ